VSHVNITPVLIKRQRISKRQSQKWTIQRNWQHRVHKTKKNKNTTRYVLDTTLRKQTQTTRTRHEPSD